MAKQHLYLHRFNVGELATDAMVRVDEARVKFGAETQENLFPYAAGKALFRPGSQYVGASLSNNQAVLLPFIKSATDRALLEATNGNLRVWVNDALVSRAAVTAPVTNGDFSSVTGWTLGTSGGATANINSSVTNALYLAGVNLGGLATCEQQVTTSNVGTEHAVNITVLTGPVRFRIGAIEGGEEYLSEVVLETGSYSLAFTPTGAVAGSDSFTKLLLHCDGTNGSTTFTDSSASAHTVTANGSAQLDTGTKEFGSASGKFDGASAYLSLDGSSGFAFGSSDFTLEMWVNWTSTATTQMLYDGRPSGTAAATYPVLNITPGGIVQYSSLSAGTPLVAGTWTHIAVTRASGTTRLFINGISQGSVADSTVYLNGASRPAIGGNGFSPGSNLFKGWIDEVRVSNGIARWVTNFIVPAASYSGSGNTFWVKFLNSNVRAAIIGSCQIASSGTMTLPAPWTGTDIAGNAFNYDQSADIVFISNASGAWQPRRILRYNSSSTSWGISLYKADDGPFTSSSTANVRLKVGATDGNTTLTADQSFFVPAHVGGLFRLTHDSWDQTVTIAAETQFTDAVRIRGVAGDNTSTWTEIVTGTWSGTLRRQSSTVSATDGFADSITTTININRSVSQSATYDNVTNWVRWGFKSGDYTSGTASVELKYAGASGSGVARVTSYVSPTQVNVEVLSNFANTIYAASWQEGEWSDNRGWPTAVQFFDGRLWWARADQFWGSISNNYYSFTLDANLNPLASGDSGSIQRSLATGGTIDQTRWIMALQRLIFGTGQQEISARASSFDQPLTPTLTTLKAGSTVGSASVPPVRLDSRGFFVEKSKTRVYELALDGSSADYAATNITKLNDEIAAAGISAMAVQRSPEPYVWMVRADGQAVLMLYDLAEQAVGFFRVILGASAAGAATIESVCVLPNASDFDSVYFSVKRTINGSTVRYIEKLAKHSEATGATSGNKIADAFVFNAGPVSTFTGLSHLEGETVIAWGTSAGNVTGKIGTTFTVSGGQISLGAAYTNVTVGLSYAWRYKSARLAFAAQGGTAMLSKKRVSDIGLLAQNLYLDSVQFGKDFTTLRSLPRNYRGAAQSTTSLMSIYEAAQFALPNIWDVDARVCLTGNAPYPVTLLGLTMLLETNEAFE